MKWIKSSFSSDTANCVYIHWHQSSLCAGGDCVRVAAGEDAILVWDSKLGDSPILRFAVSSWWTLTDAIVVADDMWKVAHQSIAYDGDEVVLSNGVRSPRLRFNRGEWEAFVYGVRAGEFDPFTLSSPAAGSLRGEPAVGREGLDTGQASSASEVRHGHDPTSNPASRVLPVVQAEKAATGAVVTPREAVPVAAEPACGCSDLVADAACGEHGVKSFLRALLAADRLDDELDLLYSPAGRLDEDPAPQLESSSTVSNPTAGQPGPEPAVAAVGGPAGLRRSEAGTGTSPGPVPAADEGPCDCPWCAAGQEHDPDGAL